TGSGTVTWTGVKAHAESVARAAIMTHRWRAGRLADDIAWPPETVARSPCLPVGGRRGRSGTLSLSDPRKAANFCYLRLLRFAFGDVKKESPAKSATPWRDASTRSAMRIRIEGGGPLRVGAPWRASGDDTPGFDAQRQPA